MGNAVSDQWGELREFARFLARESHVLRRDPVQVVQRALLQPDSTLPAVRARGRHRDGTEQRPCLRSLTKSQLSNPCLSTLVVGSAVNACDWSVEGDRVAAASEDGTLRLWDATTGVELLEIGVGTAVLDCALSPDGRLVAGVSLREVPAWESGGIWHGAGEEPVVSIWHVGTGDRTAEWPCAPSLPGESGRSAKPGNFVEWSPDGKRILAGGSLLDAATGDSRVWLGPDRGAVRAGAFAPDGRIAIWCSVSYPMGGREEELVLYDGQGSTQGTSELRAAGGTSERCEEALRRFAGTGSFHIRTDSTDSVVLSDPETGETLATLRGHEGKVVDHAFSPDGRRLLSASNDGTLKIWDTAFRQRVERPTHTTSVRSCAVDPSGREICTTSSEVLFWDAESGQEGRSLSFPEARISQGLYSSDGKRLLLAWWGMAILEMGQNEPLLRLDGYVNPEKLTSPAAFSPDGRWVVSGSGDKACLKVWNTASGEVVARLEGGREARHCSFLPDGQVVVWSTKKSWDTARVLELWHPWTGERSAPIEAGGPFTVTPDGRRVVFGEADHRLAVWEPTTGEISRRLAGHSVKITACGSAPDGLRVASAGSDQTVRLWDAPSGECLFSYVSDNTVTALAFGPAGRTLITGDRAGGVHLFSLASLEPGIPWVTTTHLYRSDLGEFERRPSVRCEWCRERFFLVRDTTAALEGLWRDLGLTIGEASCLNLPHEAWAAPQLEITCPHCARPLRLNPFVVDDRRRGVSRTGP